jgi:hypothetical protein
MEPLSVRQLAGLRARTDYYQTSSMQEQVMAEVEAQLAMAKSTMLVDFGEHEAAWKIMDPYAFLELERLRASSSRQDKEVTS